MENAHIYGFIICFLIFAIMGIYGYLREKKIVAATEEICQKEFVLVEAYENRHPEIASKDIPFMYASDERELKEKILFHECGFGLPRIEDPLTEMDKTHIRKDGSEILFDIILSQVISKFKRMPFIGCQSDRKLVYTAFCRLIGDRWL